MRLYNNKGKRPKVFLIDSMPEWSKGSDSSSDVFALVGSNPTAVNVLTILPTISSKFTRNITFKHSV